MVLSLVLAENVFTAEETETTEQREQNQAGLGFAES